MPSTSSARSTGGSKLASSVNFLMRSFISVKIAGESDGLKAGHCSTLAERSRATRIEGWTYGTLRLCAYLRAALLEHFQHGAIVARDFGDVFVEFGLAAEAHEMAADVYDFAALRADDRRLFDCDSWRLLIATEDLASTIAILVSRPAPHGLGYNVRKLSRSASCPLGFPPACRSSRRRWRDRRASSFASRFARPAASDRSPARCCRPRS